MLTSVYHCANGALSGRRLPGELLLLEIQPLLIHAGKACLVEWVRKQKQRNARIHGGDGDYVGDIGPAFSNRGRAFDEKTLKWLLGKYRDITSGGIFKIKQYFKQKQQVVRPDQDTLQ